MIAEADGKGRSRARHTIQYVGLLSQSKIKEWSALINSITILCYYVKCGGLVIRYCGLLRELKCTYSYSALKSWK